MKSISSLVILSMLFLTSLHAQNTDSMEPETISTGESINWLTIEEAWVLNQAKPKKIFIDVYTNWCGWCKRMDATTFADPNIISYLNKNFYSVKLNAEGKDPITLSGQTFKNPNPEGRRSAHELAAQFLQGQMSYPSYVFLNEKNEKLTVVKGYLQTDALEPILYFFGTNEYLSKNWEDYKASFIAPRN